MFHCESQSVRTHDLLEIDANQLIAAHVSAPQWVEESLRQSPLVVVRRGLATACEIPVGIRGAERNQRWASSCHRGIVRSVLTPLQLRVRAVPISRADVISAFRAFAILKDRWKDLDLPWGPGGSVGFELATGRHAVKSESDLDIVLYSERRMTAEEANSLCHRAMDLPAVVDIRVETPVCGFSLIEYARAESKAILLRTPSGHLLGDDPWSDELKLSDAALSVGERFKAP
jgi:phosphoribosyl-dephospho-CoA transferase